MDFASMSYVNQDNAGGIPLRLYFCQHSDIATFPTVVDFADVDLADETQGTIDGVPVLKQGKLFLPIDIADSKGSIEAATQGEKGGKSKKISLKFNLDAISMRNLKFERGANNGRFCFMVQDLNSKKWFFPGVTVNNPMILADGKSGTGEGREGKAGSEYTFECSEVVLPTIIPTTQELTTLLGEAVS